MKIKNFLLAFVFVSCISELAIAQTNMPIKIPRDLSVQKKPTNTKLSNWELFKIVLPMVLATV